MTILTKRPSILPTLGQQKRERQGDQNNKGKPSLCRSEKMKESKKKRKRKGKERKGKEKSGGIYKKEGDGGRVEFLYILVSRHVRNPLAYVRYHYLLYIQELIKKTILLVSWSKEFANPARRLGLKIVVRSV